MAFLQGDWGKASGLLIRASSEAKVLKPNPAMASRLMRQWRMVKFEVLQRKVRELHVMPWFIFESGAYVRVVFLRVSALGCGVWAQFVYFVFFRPCYFFLCFVLALTAFVRVNLCTGHSKGSCK